MKKVAILTQPLHTNYGGTIQAYALQKVLKDMGADVETINYRKKESSNIRKLFSFFKNYLKNQKGNYPFFHSEQIIRQKKHSEFIEKYISMSVEINSSDQLYQYVKLNGFNNIIVGSDQVWRKSYSPNIKDYFFNFIGDDAYINKVTYAASFGLDNWEYSIQETAKIKLLANKINNISVREDSAVILCRKFLNSNTKLVLDPTLLLNKEDYIKNFNLQFMPNQVGIFKYILDKNIKNDEIIKLIKFKLNKDVFSAQPNKISREGLFIFDIENYVYPSIESWLSAFYNADYIVTDSFHGSVFSIIFNKPFITIVNKERGASRFESLFSLLDINDRLFYDDLSLDVDLLIKDIDYTKINAKLANLQLESLEWLKESLK